MTATYLVISLMDFEIGQCGVRAVTMSTVRVQGTPNYRDALVIKSFFLRVYISLVLWPMNY